MENQATPHAVSLESTIDIGYLKVQEAEFYKTPGGFTALRYQGKDYPRVALRRALPIGQPHEYISIADSENKEIAILRTVTELSAEQMSIVNDELSKRYYCPQIFEVKSVKDKMGYVYMELLIGDGREKFEKNCAVKDVNKNVRMLDEERLLIFDVDGNRYIIESLKALDKKSLKRLEPYMF